MCCTCKSNFTRSIGATHVLDTAAEIPPARKSFMKATGSDRDILWLGCNGTWNQGYERQLCPGVFGPRTKLPVKWTIQHGKLRESALVMCLDPGLWYGNKCCPRISVTSILPSEGACGRWRTYFYVIYILFIILLKMMMCIGACSTIPIWKTSKFPIRKMLQLSPIQGDSKLASFLQ